MRKTRILLWLLVTALVLPAKAAHVLNAFGLNYTMKEPVPPPPSPRLYFFLHHIGGNEKAFIESMQPHYPRDGVMFYLQAPLYLHERSFSWFLKPEQDKTMQNLKQTRSLVANFIREMQKKYHSTPEKTFLIGFSQGGAMVADLALTHPQLFAAGAVISSRMMRASRKEVVSAPSRPLVVFYHGGKDDVTSLAEIRADEKFLRQQGYKAVIQEDPVVGHHFIPSQVLDFYKRLQPPADVP